MSLTPTFLNAYPEAYINQDGYIVVGTTRMTIYHPTMNFLIRGYRGFKTQDDELEQIIYGVYPCNEHIGEDGDTWISSDRTPTYTKIVSVDDYNALLKQCMSNGFRVLNCDASTSRELVHKEAMDTELQAQLDRVSLERTLWK